MTKSPTALQEVLTFVQKARKNGIGAGTIVKAMIAQHSASRILHPHQNTLRCAGVTGTCTWSDSDGLLASWQRNAEKRVAERGRNASF